MVKQQSSGEKNCDRCATPASLRYRCQYEASAQWRLICPDCWQVVSPNNPDYRYGGTWKARKNRA
jgi:hypothetical protein